MSRRAVLAGAGLAGAGAAAAGLATPSFAAKDGDPFTLGVASGDPWPDGFVIWTRLALIPEAEDGRGGMPRTNFVLTWELSEDEGFTRVIRKDRVTATPETAHAVHVTLTGLEPGREYWYRFSTNGYRSRVGRGKTAPAAGTMPSSLSFTMASCAQWEHGWFTAYRHMAAERPDLMLHLGDYYYEHSAGGYPVGSGAVRWHPVGEMRDLASYRQRMAIYKTDPDLQAAHAAAPWAVIWDDHEVDNNWAGDTPEILQAHFLRRRRDAFRAYYENMPLRASSAPTGYDMQLYRRLQWGQLATFHLLDTRQYRSDQANADLVKIVGREAKDPRRTITGKAQEDWLLQGFASSSARWDFITQQVPFVQRDHNGGLNVWGDMDSWDGYTASRGRVIDGWVGAGVRNPVVLTGDVHESFAAHVLSDFADPTSEAVGVELITTSITSGGDGADSSASNLRYNPHIEFNNNLRGYVSVQVTPTASTARFKAVDHVSVVDRPAAERARFVISDGDRRLHKVHDTPLGV